MTISQEAKGSKIDNLRENFFYAPFDSLGCLLFRTTCWTFSKLVKVCIRQTRIDRPKSLLLKRKNAILVKMSSFERLKTQYCICFF